jgi:hypothetical protein
LHSLGRRSRPRRELPRRSRRRTLPPCFARRYRATLGNTSFTLARVTGLEPATFGVTGRRSNQLSYTRSGEAEALGPRGRSVKGGGLQAAGRSSYVAMAGRKDPADGRSVRRHVRAPESACRDRLRSCGLRCMAALAAERDYLVVTNNRRDDLRIFTAMDVHNGLIVIVSRRLKSKSNAVWSCWHPTSPNGRTAWSTCSSRCTLTGQWTLGTGRKTRSTDPGTTALGRHVARRSPMRTRRCT